jgi:hypothetical protein
VYALAVKISVSRQRELCSLELVKRQITEEAVFMKQTSHGHSAFRIEAGEAKISIDPSLSDNVQAQQMEQLR